MINTKYIFAVFLCLAFFPLYSQTSVSGLITRLKEDPRGPYKDIRWFCSDGTINPPREPCGIIGGVQHARYKDEIIELGRKEHIYLGQILAATEFSDFWDKRYSQSRLKQYLLEQYLFLADDGWIQQKSQYYRGAIQTEDEEQWGVDFFYWLLDQNLLNEESFLLIREIYKSIPHTGANKDVFRIRSLSKEIADIYTPFMDIRIKIHGRPEASDTSLVQNFRYLHLNRMTGESRAKLEELNQLMAIYYRSNLLSQIRQKANQIRSSAGWEQELTTYIQDQLQYSEAERAVIQGSAIMQMIKRELLNSANTRSNRLYLMDISILMEYYLREKSHAWAAVDLEDGIRKACFLGEISNAAGLLFDWEWNELKSAYTSSISDPLDVSGLTKIKEALSSNVNWGSSYFLALFEKPLEKYFEFEPMVSGFFDDRIRNTVLLELGELYSLFANLEAAYKGKENIFFDVKAARVRGLNPGIGKGKLYVVESSDAEIIDTDPSGIYFFQHPPSSLKLVSGLLSVNEGNLVSHIQLLARNLGIPNATVDHSLIASLKKHEGREVFFAVASDGTVVIKEARKMTKDEQNIFTQTTVKDQKMKVPTKQLELENKDLYSIRDLNAGSSGKICGPKAANLAQLKQFFPDHVVEGFVIPFGVFKDHMVQTIPGREITYWEYLMETFNPSNHFNEQEVLNRLGELRRYIVEMPLKEDFIEDFANRFIEVFGEKLGSIPVFLRSDTNMEDLKDFTGAGLNLTLFNVMDREIILKGIREVWASPYTERSFEWRQKLINNPQHVYPSILVIPSVFVDYSGVIITKDIRGGEQGVSTVAFSRGAGGAVDGQKAETWLIYPGGLNQLISPARETEFRRLKKEGGSETVNAKIDQQLLKENDFRSIRNMIYEINNNMPEVGMPAPYDIELGFHNGRLWLFQIRPFVENKKATGVNYLEKISQRKKKNNKPIPLNTALNG